jgi:hypothetical protein
MTTATNTVSIGLTAYIEAADEVEDEASAHIEAVEEVYTREINVIEEIRERDFN